MLLDYDDQNLGSSSPKTAEFLVGKTGCFDIGDLFGCE